MWRLEYIADRLIFLAVGSGIARYVELGTFDRAVVWALALFALAATAIDLAQRRLP